MVLVGGGFWFFGMQDYQRDRVHTFLEPGADPLGAGYQVRQSKIAVGSGQLAGRGYRQGTQSQLRFLPARHTDFVFAVLAEEWGFLGVLTTLGLYAVFIVNGARVAIRARDREGILLVVGLLSFIVVPRPLQHRHGGRAGADHRHPLALPLVRRLVHPAHLRRHRPHPRGRRAALREPVMDGRPDRKMVVTAIRTRRGSRCSKTTG